ncbi:hypothetical protein PMZ80_007309 [Knufia obscura]|uniref:N-acetyltransferase domain-containing protein n=2 Tax=Knufia TaxID=430999 RepID=A0AAN8F8K9_9EURO|nr:hypothetical protein PMZ80_007309 [Knufia obscura]KAK5953321.1 hypothetical protein OHC33_005889 [Knufia fluminis]
MSLRVATYADLTRISEILAAAFYDEELNDYFFPYRRQYPADYLSVWKQVVLEKWWDYNSIWLVNCEHAGGDSGQVLGVAQWSRAGSNSECLWGVRQWDPRRFIASILSTFHAFHRLIFGNRAIAKVSSSDPFPMRKWSFGPTVWPFISRHFTEPAYRRNHWELCLLGVAPGQQGRGVGTELVAWGIQRAKNEGLPAVVVGAAGTEKFYQKQGFEIYAGSCPEEDLVIEKKTTDGHGMQKKVIVNPLKQRGIRGGGIFWTVFDKDEKPVPYKLVG